MIKAWARNKQSGFTLVELLIVIVVIAILAAITMVAYNGVQAKARDSTRKSDVSVIIRALEYYYTVNGYYPASGGSTAINSGWSTTADTSWQKLVSELVPTYVSALPSDPVSTPGKAGIWGGSNYDYVVLTNSIYCGSSAGQGYLLGYHLESSAQINTLKGNCTGTQLGPYGSASNYRVMKQ